MNRIEARVSRIERTDNLSIVAFEAQGFELRMMALGLNVPVSIGSDVVLGVKATNVALAKQLRGELSISNRLKATVESVRNGNLLSSVVLRVGETPMECITTRDAAEQMALEEGDEVVALIKASELSILEVKP